MSLLHLTQRNAAVPTTHCSPSGFLCPVKSLSPLSPMGTTAFVHMTAVTRNALLAPSVPSDATNPSVSRSSSPLPGLSCLLPYEFLQLSACVIYLGAVPKLLFTVT